MQLTTPSSSRQKARGFRTLRNRFHSPDGAIDLASIMVGVLVIGIVGSVIAASVTAVIPWSQNESAKGNLDAVATAESAVRTLDGKYVVYDSHPDSEYQALEAVEVGIERPGQRLVVEVSDNGQEWVATQESASGEIFLSTSASPEVFRAVDLGYVGAAGATGGFSGVRNIVLPSEFRAAVPAGINAGAPGAMVSAVVADEAYDFGDPAVRPVIVAGATPKAPAVPEPSNTVVTTATCLTPAGDFYAYKICTGTAVPAGTALNASCRDTSSGVQYLFINSGANTGKFVRATDTDRTAFSMSPC